MENNSVKVQLEAFLEGLKQEKEELQKRIDDSKIHMNFLYEKLEIISATLRSLSTSAKAQFEERYLVPLQEEIERTEKTRKEIQQDNEITMQHYDELIRKTETKLRTL